MAGRAYLYALGAAGEKGVDVVLNWFANDMTRMMNLLGAGNTNDLTRELLNFNPEIPHFIPHTKSTPPDQTDTAGQWM